MQTYKQHLLELQSNTRHLTISEITRIKEYLKSKYSDTLQNIAEHNKFISYINQIGYDELREMLEHSKLERTPSEFVMQSLSNIDDQIVLEDMNEDEAVACIINQIEKNDAITWEYKIQTPYHDGFTQSEMEEINKLCAELKEKNIVETEQTHGCLTVTKTSIELLDDFFKDLRAENILYMNNFQTKGINKNIVSIKHQLENLGSYCECECTCGRKRILVNQKQFIAKKYVECGEECEIYLKKLKKYESKMEKINDDSMSIDRTNTVHGSLHVIKKLDTIEKKCRSGKSKYKGYIKIYDNYECQCMLCGKVKNIRSDKFNIEIKYNTYMHFWEASTAQCPCHTMSAQEIMFMKILVESTINYRIEVSFDDLIGDTGKQLRYDFEILNSAYKPVAFVECNGAQHYSLEGQTNYSNIAYTEYNIQNLYSKLDKQKRYDRLKREYANKLGITLLEMDERIYDTPEKMAIFLKANNIIDIIEMEENLNGIINIKNRYISKIR